MGSRSTKVAVGLSVLAAGGAAGCFLRAAQLRTEAKWLMARSDAQAAEYSTTLDSAMAEAQLSLLEARRTVLERVARVLRHSGHLVLGAVETAGNVPDHFAPVASTPVTWYRPR